MARGRGAEGKEIAMSDADKARNKGQELRGKAKEGLGKATGDRDIEAAGRRDQKAGNVKQAGEKLKDAVKDPDKR